MTTDHDETEILELGAVPTATHLNQQRHKIAGVFKQLRVLL